MSEPSIAHKTRFFKGPHLDWDIAALSKSTITMTHLAVDPVLNVRNRK
jgi:hypothetical protein